MNFTWVFKKQKFRRHTFFNKDQPNQDRWKRSEMFSSLLWEGKKNKTVVCVFRPKSCWAVFPTPSFFNQCVCVCVCRLSLSNSWLFFKASEFFPHPLWPSERRKRYELGTLWHSSTASTHLCRQKTETHKRDLTGFSLPTHRKKRQVNDYRR